MDAIVVEGLKKSYKGVQALAGVSFSVREGEVFGLLGPNGAGKSTTVRILATLSRMDAGRAEVAGHDVRRQAGAVRRSIGYVSQDSGVDQNGTGRENLMLQGRVQGMGGRELRDRVSELLEFVGIADAADRVVKTYSGGMRRRLDIALGLVHRPKVLFLDEPTTGLDPEARAGMWDEVGRLARQERLTILLTTHYLEEADELADRLAIVSRGQIVVEGTPRELKATLRGDAVHLELVDGRMDDARRILERLGATPESGGEGRTLVSRVENGNRALPGILSALEQEGIGVESVGVSRPSLDDVYLHYTGRDFAAEDRGRSMKVLRHTWYMVVRQARNLMREPIWIVLLLVQPMVWLVLYGQLFKNVDAPGRVRDDVLRDVPGPRDRGDERVLRGDVERHGDDLRPGPQVRRARAGDSGEPVCARPLPDRPLGADRCDPGGDHPGRRARARRPGAHRGGRLADRHPRGDPGEQRVRGHLAGNRSPHAT